MNGSDALVLNMIERDMRRLGIDRYEVEDHVVGNPSLIPVAANEVVYIGYMAVEFDQDSWFFTLAVQSPSDEHRYSAENMVPFFQIREETLGPFDQVQDVREWFDYQSTKVTKHLGNVTFHPVANTELVYVVRYIKVIMYPTQECE